jgi:alkylation response protein AidB-like acyl-CoA dehydrogenase
MQYTDALAATIDDVVAPNADDVDRNATFPRRSLDALGRAGILGLVTGTDAGGAGLALRAAAEVIEQLSRACGSTAMVVLMHYADASTPVTAGGVVVSEDAMLAGDGQGLDVALSVVLPPFLVLNAAFSLGLMEAVTTEVGSHLGATRLEHLDQALVQQPIIRADYATMRLETDRTRAFLDDTITALETGREDAMLRVLEVKAAAAEAAVEVTDLAMKVGGGAAFRQAVGIERRFRDARAARVMAPTTDALLDFVGRAISGLPLLDPVT